MDDKSATTNSSSLQTEADRSVGGKQRVNIGDIPTPSADFLSHPAHGAGGSKLSGEDVTGREWNLGGLESSAPR